MFTLTPRKFMLPLVRLYSTITALICCLFIYAAFSKLLVFTEFRIQLYRQPFSHAWAGVLAYVLPLSELLAAGLLLFKPSQLFGLLLSALLLSIFTGYIALVVIGMWKHVPCSCGGILGHVGWSGHLVMNLSFLTAALTAIIIHFKERRPCN